MKDKMAIIGNSDSVLCFKAVGVDAYSSSKHIDVESLLKKLAKEYKIIFITEDLARDSKKVIDEYLSVPYPIILPVPSKAQQDGKESYGMESLKEAMEKALGVNLFINEEN